MVIPWRLVLTAAAGILLGAYWASRRGRSHGVADNVPADVAIVLAITALVTGRLTVLAADVALLGSAAVDLRAALTLGAGVSTSGALLGALVAGTWLQQRGKVPEGAWRAAVPPVALGLSLWSLLSLVRGNVAGISAPFPFGWPLPGADGNRVPVGIIEALIFGVFAWLVWRAERQASTHALARMSGSRLAALLLALVAGMHLVGSVLRAAVPTVDGDLDTLLGVLVFGMALAIMLDASRTTLRRAGLATGLATLVIAVLLLVGVPAPDGYAFSEAGEVDTTGLIVAGDTSSADPRAWDEAALAAFVAAQGKPVVVNVWASWCAPCRAEAPVLGRAAQAYGDEVVFIGINVDRGPKAARAFATRYHLPFASAWEAPGLRRALGVAGLPTTVVLRADGTVAARIIGGLDAGSLAAAIDRARS